ncbi:trehalose-6-phosphate synthase [Streptomyces sp. FXJ1.172]|uniref:trehalose-6-phosphate synthase n=1 Tax=Streptomyces sp. FXJ1.172 TaxID=710705 RepID=UPI000B195F19|nr:trehalose-6-phosphate synthase [Streptomyces sp. FXJ1.172]WEO93487.1 trehalose-6-phosphate synthase [Streptomyces sp. FXJ1.172]
MVNAPYIAHRRTARPAAVRPSHDAARVLVTDLDGTLLAGDDRARRRLRHLLDLHPCITVVFATGRSVHSVRSVLAADPLVPVPRWIIADVGASVVDAVAGSHLDALETRLRAGWPGADRVRSALEGFTGLAHQDGVVQEGRCSFYLPPEHLTADLKAAVAELGCSWTYSAGRYFDVLPVNAGKGAALRELARMLGWPVCALLVAGDSLNDLSLFDLGAHGVVMGNAEPGLAARVPPGERVHRPPLDGAAAILSALEDLGWISRPSRVVVGYHRPPLRWSEGRWQSPVSPNGILPTLTSALDPRACDQDAVWAAALVTDQDAAPAPARDTPFTRCACPAPPTVLSLALLPVASATWAGYFHGACKETLWPALVSAPDLIRHDPRHWADFEQVNAAFSDHIDAHAAHGATIWLHDYNLWLVPGLLKPRRPDVTIGIFHHTPFPTPDTFRRLPTAGQLRTSLTHLDWAGFHTTADADNFQRLLAGTARPPRTGVHPLGIDLQAVQSQARTRARSRRHRPRAGTQLVLSVERLDYAKAPVHKIRALATLFERAPEFRGRVCFRLICPPPEPGVSAYETTRTQLEQAIADLNSHWGSPTWQPVDYVPRTLPFPRIVDNYLAADVFWVTSLADGMNLTAQEYVACSAAAGRSGILVLSRHAGVAEHLGRAALLTDPDTPHDLVDTLHQALTMTPEQRRLHTARLAACLTTPAPADWARTILKAIPAAEKAIPAADEDV